MLSMKLRIAQQNHLYDSSLPSDSVERLFRGILSVLLDLFSRSHLAKTATRDTLKELLNVLLPFVVVTITPITNNNHNTTPRIDASSNEDFVRIVNVIVLKILQQANMTNVLTALIRLLTECCLQNDFSINDPFVKLVLKCHYRLVRMFPLALKNNPSEIDSTQILIEISSFLKQLPSRRWQSSPNNDFPLRIIKTYLQQLVDERQRLILDDLSRIPNDQQPISEEMRHYIHRKLKAITVSSSTTNEQVTQQHQAMLKAIFQKFARREQVKIGLEELYDFKLRFPNVDINPFLATTADAFQKFIHEGLARVHAQRTATTAASMTTNLTSPSSTVLRDKTQTLTSIPTQSSPNSFYSQYDLDLFNL
jgi:cytoskeleton-associated protein 5